jgi:hypothetical protein
VLVTDRVHLGRTALEFLQASVRRDRRLVATRFRRLLVVVDQFEELLNQTPRDQRAHFAELLCAALVAGSVQCRHGSGGWPVRG